MQDKPTVGSMQPSDIASDFNVTNAVIRRALSMMGADTLVQVKAVRSAGLNPVGYVDIWPIVHQQDGQGNVVPHEVIYNVPYLRIQGGKRAFICDPQVGDIGAAIICGRDISSAKTNRAASAPGSYRQHDMADALYVGGYLNATPEEYCGWINGDFHVKTSGKFVVDAAECDIHCKVSVSGAIAASGDVKAGSISLEKHVHGGVYPGSGATDAPE